MRFRLRTLMIVLALGPPVLAGVWRAWPKAGTTEEQRAVADFDKLIDLITATLRPDSWDDVGGPGSIDAFAPRCFVLIEVEDGPDGSGPCGRSYSFRPYSPNEDDGIAALRPTEPTITPSPSDDPFAPR
jgi:hypothetical protein